MFAAILWSLDGVLRRQLGGLPAIIIIFWEHVFGFLLLMPYVAYTKHQFASLKRSQIVSIVAVSLLSGFLGTWLYTSALGAIDYIAYSVVILLQQLQPLFAIASAHLFLGEKLSPKFGLYAVIALVASYFVSFPDLQVNFGSGDKTGVVALFAIGAAAVWGVSTTLSKYSLKGTPFLHMTAIRFGVTPLFIFPIIFFTGQQTALLAVDSWSWLYIAFITLSTGLIALAVYYYGLQRIPASRSTIFELAWPLSAAIIGFTLLNERFTFTQFIGAVALLFVMYQLTRETRDEPVPIQTS